MGTIFGPLNAMFGRFELEQIAADADGTAVLSTPALIAKLGVEGTGKSPDELRIFDLRVPGYSTAYDAIVARGRTFEDARLSDDDAMAIVSTSVTPAVPKRAALPHRAVDPAMQGLIPNLALRAGEERMLILAPRDSLGGVVT